MPVLERGIRGINDRFAKSRFGEKFLRSSAEEGERAEPSQAPLDAVDLKYRSLKYDVQKLDVGEFTGLQIGDRIMLYSKNGICRRDPFTVDTRQFTSVSRVLVMDVCAGTWKVEGRGGTGKVKVSKEGGFLFFKVDPGIYELSFLKGNAALKL